TYTVDLVTGTPSAPVYTAGGTSTRTGGGCAQPGGQLLPQSAPNSGTSACSPPCLIETQDAQVRSAPVYRGGSLYYTQTIGLPAALMTHTAVQWTKINATGGAFQDGGRIEDPTATSTNGGTTGANSSRWSTYWASVAGPPTVTLAPGPSLNEGNSGNTAFQFTVNFSNPPPLPMTVNYQTSDGTATVADNDYQSATGTLAVPPGLPGGTITINVIGDTKVEPNETFTLTLTGATNGTIGSPNTATGTILN